MDSMLNSAEEVQDLMSVVSRMNQLPPPPPLLKMFTVDTGQRKVTSASISCPSGYLCCSFQDSSLAVWNTKKVLHLPEPSTSSLDLACSIGCHHPHRPSSVSPPLPATACTESAVFCHGHTGPVYSVQFTPATYSSSPHLLSASDDTTLRLWLVLLF
jgi:WD40 repeat protein